MPYGLLAKVPPCAIKAHEQAGLVNNLWEVLFLTIRDELLFHGELRSRSGFSERF